MSGSSDPSLAIKWYDFLGNELHVGDDVVLARPSRFLRIVKLASLEVRSPLSLGYVAEWYSEEFLSKDISAGAYSTKCKYKYRGLKSYKNLDYISKHGIKIRRLMKYEHPSAMP